MRQQIISRKNAVILLVAVLALLAIFLTAQLRGADAAPVEPVAIAGTWVDADSWEAKNHDCVVFEFTDDGRVYSNGSIFAYSYYPKDETRGLYCINAGFSQPIECTVTGGYMRLSGRVELPGMTHYVNEFIRVSESVGLSEQQLAELY